MVAINGQGGGLVHPDGGDQGGGGVGERYRRALQTLPYEVQVGDNLEIILTERLDNQMLN